MVSGSFRKMFDEEEETKLSHYLKASILSHTQQKIEFNVCAYIRSDLSSYTVKIIYIFFVGADLPIQQAYWDPSSWKFPLI